MVSSEMKRKIPYAYASGFFVAKASQITNLELIRDIFKVLNFIEYW
jgi:hypothetical protein